MSAEVTKTLAATDQWSVRDQLELLNGLWERLIESGWRPGLSDKVKQELDRRLEDLDAHPENALTWEQVKERLRLPS